MMLYLSRTLNYLTPDLKIVGRTSAKAVYGEGLSGYASRTLVGPTDRRLTEYGIFLETGG